MRLRYCRGIRDGTAMYLKWCRDLRAVDLLGCDMITDATVMHLRARSCRGLQSVNLGWCDRVRAKCMAPEDCCGDSPPLKCMRRFGLMWEWQHMQRFNAGHFGGLRGPWSFGESISGILSLRFCIAFARLLCHTCRL